MRRTSRPYFSSALDESDPWAHRRTSGEFDRTTEVVEVGSGCIRLGPLPVADALRRLVATSARPKDLRGIWSRARVPGCAQ